MTHVSLIRTGSNTTGKQVNAVLVEPTFAYGWGLLRFHQPVSRCDARTLP